MITTLLNIENVATMVCRVPGKEELGGASVGLESWDMDERSEEHTSELQSHSDLVCRLLLETKKHTSELQSHSAVICRLLVANEGSVRFADSEEGRSPGGFGLVGISCHECAAGVIQVSQRLA